MKRPRRQSNLGGDAKLSSVKVEDFRRRNELSVYTHTADDQDVAIGQDARGMPAAR